MTAYPPFEADTAPGEAAAGVIRGYCRWHIWPVVTETVVIDGPGSGVLLLPTLKLRAVVAISERQSGFGVTPVDLVVADDVDWSESGIVRRVNQRAWTGRARGLTVTFTHGYDRPPAEIVELAAALTKRAASNPTRLRRMQVGQRSEDYATAGLQLDEMSILDPYRRIV